jgi:hypothetical protein
MVTFTARNLVLTNSIVAGASIPVTDPSSAAGGSAYQSARLT